MKTCGPKSARHFNPEKVIKRVFSPVVCSRVLPVRCRLLSRLDVPGRFILHCVHHASMHNQCGPLFEPQVPHEVWAQQNSETRHSQNHVRVAAVYCHESSPQPHVRAGKLKKVLWLNLSNQCMDSSLGKWEDGEGDNDALDTRSYAPHIYSVQVSQPQRPSLAFARFSLQKLCTLSRYLSLIISLGMNDGLCDVCQLFRF